MNIILYTIGCPKCEILKSKLDVAKINYTICEDTNIMLDKGITHLPNLEVDDKLYNFKEAVSFINSQGGC